MATKHADHHKGVRKNEIAGAGCQAIEGNPLTEQEILMFETFEREGWTPERRRAHILALVTSRSLNPQR